jgi:hypothetical protein
VIGGVVLDTSAVLDIATGATIYGQAFVSTAMTRGVVLLIPSTCLGRAWTAIPDTGLPLLDLLLEMPVVVVDNLDSATARGLGHVLRSASVPEDLQPSLLAEGHVVYAARTRGWRILTRAPEPLWAIDPALAIETPPPD